MENNSWIPTSAEYKIFTVSNYEKNWINFVIQKNEKLIGIRSKSFQVEVYYENSTRNLTEKKN